MELKIIVRKCWKVIICTLFLVLILLAALSFAIQYIMDGIGMEYTMIKTFFYHLRRAQSYEPFWGIAFLQFADRATKHRILGCSLQDQLFLKNLPSTRVVYL